MLTVSQTELSTGFCDSDAGILIEFVNIYIDTNFSHFTAV